MPVVEIPPERWAYNADLGDAPAAASFSATYRSRKADGSFDPVFFNGIQVYRGGSNPHLVRIKPTVDGLTETLVLGVVDRNGVSRGDDGDVAGLLSGRDLIALALDNYPTAPFTLDGFTVKADGTLAFRETFKGAMRRLASEAGLTVLFDCPDYELGKSVPVTTDRTVAEVMQELLRPLRWSVKNRVDVWIEGTTLRVARRGQAARGTVAVDAARIHVERMDRTSLPAVAGVRVEGAGYEVEEADTGGAGLPSLDGQPYSTSQGPFTVTRTVAGKTTTYIDEGTQWYDGQGRMTHSFRKCTYLLLANEPTTRVESWEKTCTFFVDSTVPFDGAPKTERETYRVLQAWPVEGGGVSGGEEVIREREAEWRYFADNGDLLMEDGFEVEKDEEATLPLPLKTNRVTKYRYRRSGGRILRDQEITEQDPATGAVTRSFGTTDQGPFNADAGQRIEGVARAGKRMARRLVSAGPEPTSGKFRIERSELLGDAADCEAIRQDLIDEHASIHLEASFAMEPDLRVKPGKVLTVQSAPAWWPATSWLVTAVAKDATGDVFGMRVEGEAWQAAP